MNDDFTLSPFFNILQNSFLFLSFSLLSIFNLSLFFCLRKNQPLKSRKQLPFISTCSYLSIAIVSYSVSLGNFLYSRMSNSSTDSYVEYIKHERVILLRHIAGLVCIALNVVAVLYVMNFAKYHILREMTLQLFGHFKNRQSVKEKWEDIANTHSKKAIHGNKCWSLMLSYRFNVFVGVFMFVISFIAFAACIPLYFLVNMSLSQVYPMFFILACIILYVALFVILMLLIIIDIKRSIFNPDYIKLHGSFSLSNFFIHSDRNCVRVEVFAIIILILPSLGLPLSNILFEYIPTPRFIAILLSTSFMIYNLILVLGTIGGMGASFVTIIQLIKTSYYMDYEKGIISKQLRSNQNEDDNSLSIVVISDINDKGLHQMVSDAKGGDKLIHSFTLDIDENIKNMLQDSVGYQLIYTFTASEFLSENIVMWKQIQSYRKLFSLHSFTVSDPNEMPLISKAISTMDSKEYTSSLYYIGDTHHSNSEKKLLERDVHSFHNKTADHKKAIVCLGRHIYWYYIAPNSIYEIHDIPKSVKARIEKQLDVELNVKSLSKDGNTEEIEIDMNQINRDLTCPTHDMFDEVQTQILSNIRESFLRLKTTTAYKDYIEHKIVLSKFKEFEKPQIQ